MRKLSAAAAVLIVSLATPAMAMDGITIIDEGEPMVAEAPAKPVPGAPAPCPTLTQIKYPWLSCQTDTWGNTVVASTGQVEGFQDIDRVTSKSFLFVRGDWGYWGPENSSGPPHGNPLGDPNL